MVVECARCMKIILADETYKCDQCGELVCVDCLAVVGSDNTESVCCQCPAMTADSPAITLVDGKGKTYTASVRDMFGERLEDVEDDYYDEDGMTYRDRVDAGDMTPEDAERRQCEADERSER